MKPDGSVRADVCVIGGGPAGSTIARQLATLGHDVCLIEGEKPPARRIAASLPPSILPLLGVIGVRDEVENAGFHRARRMIVWWAEASPAIRELPGSPGFHVDRSEFDGLLLRNAGTNGVRVLRPARATSPHRLSEGGWRIAFHGHGQAGEVVARILVDASGGRIHVFGRRKRASAPLLAIYACWRTVRAMTEARIEAGRNEWFWGAPVAQRSIVVAVFLDPRRRPAIASANMQLAYKALVSGFRLLRDIQPECIEGPVVACDASSRFAEDPVGLDFIRVGDANMSLDPLSSQGILSAIAGGIQASFVINTLLRSPANAETAVAFYQARQQEQIRRYAAKTAGFYQERATVCDEAFWRLRSIGSDQPSGPLPPASKELDPECRIQMSNMTFIKDTPIIRDNLVVTAPAVHHAALERPVAFIDQVEIVPLLRHVHSGHRAKTVVRAWSDATSRPVAWGIMQWLWKHGVVVPVSRRHDSPRYSNFNAPHTCAEEVG